MLLHESLQCSLVSFQGLARHYKSERTGRDELQVTVLFVYESVQGTSYHKETISQFLDGCIARGESRLDPLDPDIAKLVKNGYDAQLQEYRKRDGNESGRMPNAERLLRHFLVARNSYYCWKHDNSGIDLGNDLGRFWSEWSPRTLSIHAFERKARWWFDNNDNNVSSVTVAKASASNKRNRVGPAKESQRSKRARLVQKKRQHDKPVTEGDTHPPAEPQIQKAVRCTRRSNGVDAAAFAFYLQGARTTVNRMLLALKRLQQDVTGRSDAKAMLEPALQRASNLHKHLLGTQQEIGEMATALLNGITEMETVLRSLQEHEAMALMRIETHVPAVKIHQDVAGGDEVAPGAGLVSGSSPSRSGSSGSGGGSSTSSSSSSDATGTIVVAVPRGKWYFLSFVCRSIGSLLFMRFLLTNYSVSDASLTMVPMKGDGNCFYRSISDQLHGDSGTGYTDVKKQVIAWEKKNKTFLSKFLEEDVNIHLSKICREGEWADNHEVFAAAQVFR